MNRIFAFALIALMPLAAQAQTQQAGAAVDTDAAFQALIDACDDNDALILRARIRLQIPRANEEDGAAAQQMMEDAFATCAEGDLEAAKAQLTETLAFAEERAAANIAAGEAAAAAAAAEAEAQEASAEEEDGGPWWKFW